MTDDLNKIIMATDKENRVAALTLIESIKTQSKSEKELMQLCKGHILDDKMETAKIVIEIIQAQRAGTVTRKANGTALDAATDETIRITDAFQDGDATEEELDDAVQTMYRELLQFTKEKRGLPCNTKGTGTSSRLPEEKPT